MPDLQPSYPSCTFLKTQKINQYFKGKGKEEKYNCYNNKHKSQRVPVSGSTRRNQKPVTRPARLSTGSCTSRPATSAATRQYSVETVPLPRPHNPNIAVFQNSSLAQQKPEATRLFKTPLISGLQKYGYRNMFMSRQKIRKPYQLCRMQTWPSQGYIAFGR